MARRRASGSGTVVGLGECGEMTEETEKAGRRTNVNLSIYLLRPESFSFSSSSLTTPSCFMSKPKQIID